MGKQARLKRERRLAESFVASLTTSQGTWLERPADAEEQARIKAAGQELARQRKLAQELSQDTAVAFTFSLELFRREEFAPLHFEDWVVEEVLARHGEPPIVERPDDPAFTDYLKRACADFASTRVRRAMAEQVRRLIPGFVERGELKEALAIDYNAYYTVMSATVTPLLVQMMVAALARWYEEHEEDVEDAGFENVGSEGNEGLGA
jgi:hypothetical protein